MDHWEELLDLDASDLSSSAGAGVLRRIDRRQSQPVLQPHSSGLSCNQVLSQPHPPLSPPTPPHSGSLRRRIAGPAGAVQAAMHRKERDYGDCVNGGKEDEISTQEFIRRVEEGDNEEFDRNPWVFALDLVRIEGGADRTPLSTVKRCVNAERFDKIIAIVTSCNPNGLGDMTITLKDPTDCISASVHRKVVNEGNFGKEIVVGSVLILQKVVAFPVSRISTYLNVTFSNVVKVISSDCRVLNFPSSTAPQSTSGCNNTFEISEKARFPRKEGTQNVRGSEVIEKLVNKGNQPTASGDTSRMIEISRSSIGQISTQNTLLETHSVSTQATRVPFHFDRDEPFNGHGIGKEQGRGLSGFRYTPNDIQQQAKFRDNNFATVTASCVNNAETQSMKGVHKVSNSNAVEEVGDQNGRDAGAVTRQREPFITRTVTVNSVDIADAQKTRSIHKVSNNNAVEEVADKNGRDASGIKMQREPLITRTVAVNSIDNADAQKTRTIDRVSDNRAVEEVGNRNGRDDGGVKAQREPLIMRMALEEWTDEQIDILDMDED